MPLLEKTFMESLLDLWDITIANGSMQWGSALSRMAAAKHKPKRESRATPDWHCG